MPHAAAPRNLLQRKVFRSGEDRMEPESVPYPSLAYSLCQVEEGWRWSVYDEGGVTVADGAHASRDAAEAAVESTLRSPPAPTAAFG